MVLCCRYFTPPPYRRDGAWAWLVCFSATFANSLHFGFTQSFGVFLPVLGEEFNENREKTAWAGSIALSITLLVGPIPVILSERYSHRLVAIASGVLCAISLAASSFATGIVFLYFTYGILFGIGAGCILNTGYGITGRYFSSNKRSITVGIIASGSSLGVMYMGPTLQALVDALGWRNTFRVMAGVMSVICLLGATYHPNIANEEVANTEKRTTEQSPRRIRSFIDCSMWRNITFVIGTVAIMLTHVGLYVPSIHIVRFANDLHIPSTKASRLFIIIGVFSTVSRVLSGRVLDKRWLSPLHGVQLSSLVMGVAIISLAWATNYTHLIIFAIAFGIVNGSFITTITVFFQTSVEPHKSAIGLGMGYMACSVLILAGPPGVGFIADELGSYIPSFYVIGGILLFAAVFPFLLRFTSRRESRELVAAPEMTDKSDEIECKGKEALDSTELTTL